METQKCPYCGYTVDDANAEWEKGEHEVECIMCKRTYLVDTVY